MVAHMENALQQLDKIWNKFYLTVNNTKYINNRWLARLHNDYFYLVASIIMVISTVVYVMHNSFFYFIIMVAYFIVSLIVVLTHVRFKEFSRLVSYLHSSYAPQKLKNTLSYIQKYGASKSDKTTFRTMFFTGSNSLYLSYLLEVERDRDDTVDYINSLDGIKSIGIILSYMLYFRENNIKYSNALHDAFRSKRNVLLVKNNYNMDNCLEDIFARANKTTYETLLKMKTSGNMNKFIDFMLEDVSDEVRLGIMI